MSLKKACKGWAIFLAIWFCFCISAFSAEAALQSFVFLGKIKSINAQSGLVTVSEIQWVTLSL